MDTSSNRVLIGGKMDWNKLFNSSPLNKMADILQDNFRSIFMNEKFCILIKISLKFVPKGLIDNNPALV